jgi:hypothetical protein
MQEWLHIATLLLASGAVYGAIRMDIRSIHRDIERHESIIEKLRDKVNEK